MSDVPVPVVATERFFYRLLLPGLLALCAVYAALVLGQASYTDAVALSRITFHDGSYQRLPVRVSGAEFLLAQRTVASLAAALALAALLPLRRVAMRREVQALGQEAGQAVAGIGRCLRGLPAAQQWAAVLGLVVLTAARTYFSIIKSYHSEEVASYDFFISRGLLAVSSFYPIPNNHVLSNTLSWAIFQLTPNVWLTLRLPVLLTSTVGTVVLFAGLRRFGTFRMALMSVTLFSWMQLSLYNAVAGRGYWLLMTLAGVHFLALLALLYRRHAPRVAWLALVLSGMLGCYTVPSFAYVVASAASYAALVFWRRHDWPSLRQTVVAGAVVLAGAAALYLPLLLLSGWRLLLANNYVVAQPWAELLMQLPAFGWFTEGTLAGQRTIGALVPAVAVAAFGWLWLTGRLATLPPDLRQTARRLVLPALWFAAVPYALLTAQRVLPPERVLLYKALYSFVVVSFLLEAWLRTRHDGRWWSRATGLGVALFVAYQAYTMQWLVTANQRYIGAIDQAYGWLQGQPPGRILVRVDETALHFLYFAHTRPPRRQWQLDDRRQPGTYYRYIIVAAGRPDPDRPPPPARPAYQDGVNEIYVVPQP